VIETLCLCVTDEPTARMVQLAIEYDPTHRSGASTGTRWTGTSTSRCSAHGPTAAGRPARAARQAERLSRHPTSGMGSGGGVGHARLVVSWRVWRRWRYSPGSISPRASRWARISSAPGPWLLVRLRLLVGRVVALAEQAQQQVLGAHIGMVQATGLPPAHRNGEAGWPGDIHRPGDGLSWLRAGYLPLPRAAAGAVLLVDGLLGDAQPAGDLLPGPAAGAGVVDLEGLQDLQQAAPHDGGPVSNLAEDGVGVQRWAAALEPEARLVSQAPVASRLDRLIPRVDRDRRRS
jgi:hypothetical protein